MRRVGWRIQVSIREKMLDKTLADSYLASDPVDAVQSVCGLERRPEGMNQYSALILERMRQMGW